MGVAMFEVRFHGRGGQGVWTSSQILARAALIEGKHVQSFPMFGPERLGGLVMSFVRISDKPIRVHSMVYNPDAIVVLDPYMVAPDTAVGAKDSTVFVVNCKDGPSAAKSRLGVTNKVWAVDANKLSAEVIGRVVVNTPLLGALVKATGIVSLDALAKATLARFPGEVGEKNVELIRKAYEEVTAA